MNHEDFSEYEEYVEKSVKGFTNRVIESPHVVVINEDALTVEFRDRVAFVQFVRKLAAGGVEIYA